MKSKSLLAGRGMVPEACSAYGLTIPMVVELDLSMFKNLGKSQIARTAIIARIKNISMGVSFLYFPMSLSFNSFRQLTQVQIIGLRIL